MTSRRHRFPNWDIYDSNGNASSRQGSSITWTSYNYPASASAGSGSTAETVNFAYGPDRSRWQQNYTGNSTTETTDYIGSDLELVISGGVSDYRHYIYAGTEPVAVYSRKSTGVNTFSYLLSDHQGSVADITNSSGVLDVQESFTPFGNRRNPTTWSGAASTSDLTTAAAITREGYTFQTQLGLWMGMNHMNGRVQDAITGRFLSADPQGIVPDNTQSFNRYSYVTNNPLTMVDSTGFDTTYYSPFACTTTSDFCFEGNSCGGMCPPSNQDEYAYFTPGSQPNKCTSGPCMIGTDTSLQDNYAAQQQTEAVAVATLNSLLNTGTASSNANQGVPVLLPNGQFVPDPNSPTGYLMSPVADLSNVVAAGRAIGANYSAMLNTPDGYYGAYFYLGGAPDAAVSQGGVFDYQRQGNAFSGYTQYPQFRDVSNFNVGLITQAAGLTQNEALSIAGGYASQHSGNSNPAMPYGLNARQAAFIKLGYAYGQSGVFGN